MSSFPCRLLLLVALTVGTWLVAGVGAQEPSKKDDKQQTFKGTICCALCELDLNLQFCKPVIVVKEPADKAGKVYGIDKQGDAKFDVDNKICVEAWEGEVTGVIGDDLKDKDGQVLKDKKGNVVKLITVSNVTFLKKIEGK